MCKNTFMILKIILCLIFTYNAVAQVDPGKENLIHQWTFDDNTANDNIKINPVNGILHGGAKIKDKALILSEQGQYLSFAGSELALNTYSTISLEIWFKSIANTNTGYTMLAYFGNTSGGLGYNYYFMSAARKDNVSRVAISSGTYNNEVYINGPEYDDGLIHQMISVVSNDSIQFYIDGKLIGKAKNNVPLSTIGTSLAFIGKSGYTDDPTWLGTIYKISIYNKKLNADEIKFLYNKGPEDIKIFNISKNSLAFDEFLTFEKITISLINITDTIYINAPKGINIDRDLILPINGNIDIKINYDTNYIVDGNIIFSSNDSMYGAISVKSYNNLCYKRLYTYAPNLIFDPYISNINYFVGWGNRSINNNIQYVYCGATSGMVSGKNGGSLDVDLTGKLLPETMYRIKAKVFLIGGSFQIGIYGWSDGKEDYTKVIYDTNTWYDVDFCFTTGKNLGSKQGVFFNNYGLTGITGYIDNWEMYAVPKIYLSKRKINFFTNNSTVVNIRSVNLTSDIIIIVPDGLYVSKSFINKNIENDTLTISFIGQKNCKGYIYFKSDDIIDSILVEGNVDPIIIPSISRIALDEIDNKASFIIQGYNLNEDVYLNSPIGIRLSKDKFTANKILNDTLDVNYDGVSNSDGKIKIISGDAYAEIIVIAHRNEECFIPLYNGLENLITDPTCNYYTKNGWGKKSINTDVEYIYCGARSIKIENGSVERELTGKLKPNTYYRVRAKIYKVSTVKGQNMGNVTFTIYLDSTSYPEQYRLIYKAMDSACKYFNKYTPFIENIPVYYNPEIPTAQAGYKTKIEFGPNTRYMWVGTAIHEMAHYFGSGTTSIWQTLMSGGTWKGKVASDLMKTINGGVIYGDSQHFWPYGINYKEEITNLPTIKDQEIALTNSVKLIKAMLVDDCGLPTNNPSVGIGIYGWDKYQNDLYYEVSESNSWQTIDFTFKTGNELKDVQKIYFNYGTGYIDNWEMYDISSLNISQKHKNINFEVYVQNGIPVIRTNLDKNIMIDIAIYDILGKKIFSRNELFNAEENIKIIDDVFLKEGIYLIKLKVKDGFAIKKVISF